jgi:hypothetical protein
MLSGQALKEKVTKKFKDNPIRSARLSGQRLHTT